MAQHKLIITYSEEVGRVDIDDILDFIDDNQIEGGQENVPTNGEDLKFFIEFKTKNLAVEAAKLLKGKQFKGHDIII